MTLSLAARIAALFIALVAVAALAAQVWLVATPDRGLLPALWQVARFFTILTNALVAASFVVMVVRARALSAAWLGGLTLWIAFVGVVYHLLLARLWAPSGLAWWADQGLHSAVPVLALAWWLGVAPKAGLGLRHALRWLAWPLAYSAYALGRGALDGVYPYPFLDVGALGHRGVALNAAGLTGAFFLGGLTVVGAARLISR